jgi:glycosyltransferase involved in cell wall biosynthesis
MTKLAVFSYKDCWPSKSSQSGFSTDGGFPFQMRALSELFESTVLVVPCLATAKSTGEVSLSGHSLSVAPLTELKGSGFRRKLKVPFWLLRNSRTMLRELWRADIVHTPIPGDVGTVGMLLAFCFRKPLFVRHCGNWLEPVTVAERFWKWFMETFAGGRNLMLATGGAAEPPSRSNRNVRWIFSTSMSANELERCARHRQLPNDGRVRLAIACRQDRQKGTGIVIESLPLVLQHFPNVTLEVIGDGRDLEEFKQLAARLRVSERVTFRGRVDHITLLRVLSEAHLFCYPTRASEGFPKVVLEAMASGVPVITTGVSVLPELLSSGAGTLIDDATPHALVDSIVSILRDPQRYELMSTCAIKTAAKFSLERWREEIGELLSGCCGTRVNVKTEPIEINA